MTDATLYTAADESGRTVRDDDGAVEAFFDAVFRPSNWGARLAYSVGLQGRLRASTLSLDVSPDATATRRPLRVAFASDFHAGGLTDDRLLERACQALADLEPDVLLLGGDFVSVRASDIRRIAPLIAAIPAPLGKFGVLGNHDLRAGTRRIVPALERAGVRLIANQHVGLSGPFGQISICGLDDSTRGAPRGDLALDRAHDRRIVLMHSPEGLEAIGDRHFDLALCGHTHGGQIALPWGTPILMPGGPLNRRYSRGRHAIGGNARPRALLVSRGVGCSGLPVRLFAAPEVHLCLIT
ncbi:MAG: metallophosphoesterase [Gemmatimonadaceae bacterium]